MFEIFWTALADRAMDFNWWLALALVGGYCVVDGLYAYYTLAVTDRRPLSTANTGAIMHVLIAVGVLSYVENFLYVVPIVIGSWIGTYIIVSRSAKKMTPFRES